MQEKLSKVNLPDKKIQLALILLALNFTAFIYYFNPTWNYIRGVREEIQALQENLDEILDYISQAGKNRNEIKELEESLLNLETYLPMHKDLYNIFEELDNIILNADFEVKSVKIGEIIPGEGINHSYFSVIISFTGSKEDILVFISDIENYRPVLQIQQVEFQQEKGLYTGILEIKAYLII